MLLHVAGQTVLTRMTTDWVNDRAAVQPNAVDLRLKEVHRIKPTTQVLKEDKTDSYHRELELVETSVNGMYDLWPGVYQIKIGDTVKMANLPGVMACDRSEDWGQTTHRYWYQGHIHHEDRKEFPGVVVEAFRTLAARDAWHAGQGYRAGRDMNLIVHHKDYGEIERHRCDIAMLKGAK